MLGHPSELVKAILRALVARLLRPAAWAAFGEYFAPPELHTQHFSRPEIFPA